MERVTRNKLHLFYFFVSIQQILQFQVLLTEFLSALVLSSPIRQEIRKSNSVISIQLLKLLLWVFICRNNNEVLLEMVACVPQEIIVKEP